MVVLLYQDEPCDFNIPAFVMVPTLPLPAGVPLPPNHDVHFDDIVGCLIARRYPISIFFDD